MARLSEHVGTAMQAEITELFQPDQIADYETNLATVERYGHTRTILPVSPALSETNLDHTCDMLDILSELEQYPHLRREINFREVAFMIAFHDAGEIIVGDAPPFGPEREGPEWTRKKRQEPIMAKRYVLSQIADPDVRQEMIGLYERYIQQDPQDKEALLGRLLDKIQATTRVAATNVYNQRLPRVPYPSPAQIEHVENATSILVGAASNLHRAVSPKAGGELRGFVIGELHRLIPTGFPYKAQAKKEDIQRLGKRP